MGDSPPGDKTAVYLTTFHACEKNIASRLKSLLSAPLRRRKIDAHKAVEWVQGQLSLSLAPNQIEAIKCATSNKVMVITGGPGTGKTTIINAILKIFGRLGVDILLAAPTGRAAKRMTEATGHEARTIHRLLEFSPQKRGFQKNEEQPLKCDLLILDEASMIDTVLMHHLLKAVPDPRHPDSRRGRKPTPVGGSGECAEGHHLLWSRARGVPHGNIPAG